MLNTTTNGRLKAIAAVCLVGIALPASAVVAKEKTKPAAQTESKMEIDYSVSIPSIDAVDSSLPDNVLNDILSGNLVDHAEELAGLDATSITVPEIVVTVTSETDDGTQEATVTFADLSFDNIVDGQAEYVSVSGITLAAEDTTFSFGALSAADLNIAGILGIYGLVDSTQTELQVIYKDFSAEGGSLEAEDVSCTVGPVSGSEFKARPLKSSFAEMIAIGQALEDDPDMTDPALTGKFIRMYADILTAFETSEVIFGGMDCSGVDDDGQAVSFALGSMTMGAMSPGYYPSISMNDFSIEVEGDGSFTLDNFTFKPMDLTNLIALLEGAPERVDEAWFEANARALIPAMEGVALTGLDIDVPDPENPDSRIQAKVGAFDLTLGNYINGIPADLDVSAANIQAEIPADSGDETLDQLRALGVTDIDAGFRIAASWDGDTDTIAIEEVSMTGVDLATVQLAGTIANVTEALFSLDTDAALAAGMGIAVSDLDLTVTDAGLSDIILAVAAADQGADPASMRPIFAGLAQGTVISMMAGAADAAKLGEAVNAFVAGKAKTLMIGIEAKTPPGLGMLDFMQAEDDPATLLSKVNVSAEAK
ncbi:hypothetical protein SAMN06295905_1381 [Devosia lucknowensis]|uniref:Uncharacterized protein n=1 Tax=Devosia lucknowensis TaxID=1096929 RepID=A0A1Y6EUR6_9HYPH|nr:hypothetical protein [Devosia lucknowensis]SMQ66046.1 hypothetical protein SAMN06295905_1381 [Devosia lucknowensis]